MTPTTTSSSLLGLNQPSIIQNNKIYVLLEGLRAQAGTAVTHVT